MAIAQEMFRFVTTRRPERAVMPRIESRIIRDRRVASATSMLVKLFGPGSYNDKLPIATAFADSSDFVRPDDSALLRLEPVVSHLREHLAPEIVLSDFLADIRRTFPKLAGLLERTPPHNLVEETNGLNARLWDSLYAQTILGCDRYVSTNYLADALRVYHIYRLLWTSRQMQLTTWAGVTFDEYHTLIDLHDAFAQREETERREPERRPATRAMSEALTSASDRILQIEAALHEVRELEEAGLTRSPTADGADGKLFNAAAVDSLRKLPALSTIDLEATPVETVRLRLQQDSALARLERERVMSELTVEAPTTSLARIAGAEVAPRGTAPEPMQSFQYLVATNGVFRVPLEVGSMKPPVVGDLLLVEQELRRYELGELAEIESIMRGERRERTIRKLNRVTETTTVESSLEQEESSSLKTDERFQLSSQAQQAASESFGVQTGVSASGKFGPVQVSASVNASYDTSQSSSESTSQEYAKTVTEEATKRIRSSIKESSSVTILTETQDTSLRGFNNEKGQTHVTGLYRWVDKIYDAKLLNYGRRLMLSLNVPEPAAFYRALMQQDEADLMSDLAEPVHPSRISRTTLEPLPDSRSGGGFSSYRNVDESNYAKLAALYDVTVQPPPPEHLTGSKTIVYPEAMQAAEIKVHDAVNDLGYVTADNTIVLDGNYRLTKVGVFIPEGASGGVGSYSDALKLGEVAKPSQPSDGTTVAEANLILVQVADKSFYLQVRRDPDDPDKKVIKSNFNTWEPIVDVASPFGAIVQPSIPVTITARFEGVLALTVAYQAYRLDEAYDAWKSSTYAAIVKGYNAKKQAYDQALSAAQAKADAGTTAMTSQLRDDQYRSIELTELKRGCVDLMSAGTAAGFTSIKVKKDGTPSIVYDPAEGAQLVDWRTPLANGSVAEFFEVAFEWENTTYQFYPYYWAGKERWSELARATGADPVFEQFLRAGSASVVIPVRPGHERPVIFFLKTGLIWGGGYLSLFTSPDMMDVYADVECGRQFDPPLQVGESWEVRVPTSLIMLQEDSTLPEFPPVATPESTTSGGDLVLDESVPF